MHYPIFNSVVNTIDSQLGKRGINTNKFRTWEDNKINAIGLELVIELDQSSRYMNTLSINFDWDSFREASMAKRLEGLNSHPFLKVDNLHEVDLKPTFDVEMCWKFNIDQCQPEIPGETGNYRIERASSWMESISKSVNDLMAEDDIITRWHVEIDGDKSGRYLSAIDLISYFQYSFEGTKSLNDVNNYVSRRLQDLLLKANKVIFISDEKLDQTIAA